MTRSKIVLSVLVFSVFVSVTFAELINVGSYAFSTEASKLTYWGGDVATTDSIAFLKDPTGTPGDLHSVLGSDDGRIASWNNGSNQISTGGVEIEFDLQSSYKINSVSTFHTVASYWGIGVVDFYYSLDGESYTLLGSDGSSTSTIGEYSRSFDYNEIEAQYLKVHVHSVAWRSLEVDSVQIDATAVPEPATMLLLAAGSLCAIRKKR